MSLIPEDKKAIYRAQLIELGQAVSKEVMSDLQDMIDTGKAKRAVELMEELTSLKAEALVADPGDKPLYEEMIEDKIGSLAHVLDTERIVLSRQAADTVSRAAKTALSGFGAVGKELIKTAVKSTVGGAAGGLLGGLGEKLVDKAVDAATDAISPE